MTRYAQVAQGATVETRVVQSAEPNDLAARATAAILGLSGQIITAITLAGAGDGHDFTVTIEAAEAGDVIAGGLVSAEVAAYLAAQADALQTAREQVSVTAPLVDHQVAGAGSGHRFMGLLVGGTLAGGNGSGLIFDGIATGTTQLTTFAAASTADGTSAYVLTVRDEFYLHRDASALTPDGITIVAAAGVPDGRWVRRENVGDEAWREQAEWHIDADTGNDENDGSAAAPLATWGEMRRRLGANPVIPQSTQVLIESDLSETLHFDGKATLLSGVIYRVTGGVRTVLGSGTLSNVVAQNRGTQTPMRLDDTGIDAFVDRRIRFTDGAAAGATCWGFRSPAADQLDCVQSVTYDTSADPLPAGGTPVTPSGGDSYVVEQLFRVAGINLRFERLINPALAGESFVAAVEDLDVFAAESMCMLRSETLLAVLVRSRVGAANIAYDTRVGFESCFVFATTHFGRAENYDASLLKSTVGTVFAQQGSHWQMVGDTIMAAGQLTMIESDITFASAAVFDSNQSGIALFGGSRANVQPGTVWGDGNADFGWDIRANSVVAYQTGSQPTLTGDTGDTQIAGATVAYGAILSFSTVTAAGMVEDV